MSNRWPGGIIRKTPVTPAGPYQTGAASGVWSLADASYWTKQGLWPIAGNTPKIEDVFQTWLYTGTSAAQTITNGINISGQGGLVWIKERSNGVGLGHYLFDTARGLSFALEAETTSAQANRTTTVNAFNSNGFSMGSGGNTNNGGTLYASWTFRKAPDFFDVVTWTGDGANRNIAHNLGSVPGMILVKRTDSAADWQVYHRSNANTQYMVLNTTAAVATGTTRWNSTTPTATEFTVGTDATVNASGGTYVAYLFAHDTSSTGIIQCGSYTGNGAADGPTVTLGWEPQWLMIKRANSTGNWQILDNMRGMPVGSADATLQANLTSAEASVEYVSPTATGFQITSTNPQVNSNTSTYIYMAIRRGPMRTPTLGTSVFAPISRTGTGSSTFVSTSGFPSDNYFVKRTDGGGSSAPGFYFDRLRGGSSGGYGMSPTSTAAENSIYAVLGFNAPNNNGVRVGNTNGYWDASGSPYVDYHFRRAPGFFDTVCYTGTGAQISVPHNLGVVPEILITKRRDSTGAWLVYTATTGLNNYLSLNTTDAVASASNYSAVSATAFNAPFNNSGGTFVSYLFASCPGVSKVGSYTGTGALQTINCAFTSGARFVLIKRTDSTGDWFVWDSARGISSGNDPYTLLNTSAAQVTGTNYVDTTAVGFQVTAAAPVEINAVGGTYIFLAIA
jgi:hypothetical protein